MIRRILACILFLCCASLAAQAKRPITETDLFQFVWIGDVQMAPDGHAVAYVQTSVNADKSGYDTSIYLLDTAAGASPRLLAAGTHDSSPRWSPDSKQLAFLRSVEAMGKPSPAQLYFVGVSPITAPIALTNAPKGVSHPAWAGNGSNWTVLMPTAVDPTKPAPAAGAHVSDVRVITRNDYKSNGEGYTDPKMVPQLYRISAPNPDRSLRPAEQLSTAPFGVDDYIACNTSTFLYTTAASAEPYYDAYAHNQLFVLNPPGQADAHKSALLADLPFQASGLSVAPHPDGQLAFRIAFHAAAYPLPPAAPISHQDDDLFVLDVDLKTLPNSATPRNLTEGQGFEMGGSVGGDNTAPRGGGRPVIAWSADGTHLLDVAGSLGSALLVSVDATPGENSRPQPVSARRQAIVTFAASASQKNVVALVSNPIMIGELFGIDPSVAPGTKPGNQTQLTHVNDALFSQLDLQLPEDLKVAPKTSAGDIPFLSIDTFVQLPPHFDSTKKYPTILNIHGGPHSGYGWIFDHEMLWMAAKGYVTIYPNPRGSTTYGQTFANVIQNNYPGDDFHDLMDTVDAVIAKGWADPARLGVTGGSGGGLLTDWTVTQTCRFRAAVAQRDIVDAANWWYTSDIGPFHQYWWPAGPFSSDANLEVYSKHSPLTYVDKITTPMMFILGDADSRTPPSAGGEIFFRALKYKKIPTQMVRFPRETHELSRSGEPWHRVERLQNIVRWMDTYVLPSADPFPRPCSKP